MNGEGKDLTVNLAFSLVLHFLVFAGVFLTPSLHRRQFHVPVAYEVKLVELPGTQRTTGPRKAAPAKVSSPKVSTQLAPSTPPAKGKVSAAKPEPRPAPPQGSARPGKEKVTPTSPAPAQSAPAPQIAQAAVPAVQPASPGRGGSPGIVSESGVTTEKADATLGYYLTAIQAKVSSRWIEPSLYLNPGQEERVVLGFTVLRSGLVRDIRVLNPSESVFLDQSALRAVQEAVPLPPFPPLFPEETLAVRFHFEMRGE